MDLPLFYSIRRKYRFNDELPEETIRLIASDWTDPRLDHVNIEGWSSDWVRFTRIWDWILPVSRWGTLDRDFLHETDNVFFRNHLQTVGEIIPVLYRVKNHYEVVFRIGERLFCLRRWRKGDDLFDFELDPWRRIGVLPFTYEMFFTHPAEVQASLETENVRTNLTEWAEPSGLFQEIEMAFTAYETDTRRLVERTSIWD